MSSARPPARCSGTGSAVTASARFVLETCVTPPRAGTSYRAAGWKLVGKTAGRPPGADRAGTPKKVWLLGLASHWRGALARRPRPRGWARSRPCGWPTTRIGPSASSPGPACPTGACAGAWRPWGAAWERHPGEPLPAVFAHRAAQSGAYRFLHNEAVTHEDVLQPHREALLERCQLHREVLLVQDTTALNFTALRRSARGLGPLKDRESAARGLWVHAAVAFTPGRRPLGVSGLEVWARPEEEPTDEREKESRRLAAGL